MVFGLECGFNYFIFSCGIYCGFTVSFCLNLLKEHYIFQITGIAFLFIIGVIRMTLAVLDDTVVSLSQLYFTLLPILSAIAACLVSMSLGFWIFPIIRNKFKTEVVVPKTQILCQLISPISYFPLE